MQNNVIILARIIPLTFIRTESLLSVKLVAKTYSKCYTMYLLINPLPEL